MFFLSSLLPQEPPRLKVTMESLIAGMSLSTPCRCFLGKCHPSENASVRIAFATGKAKAWFFLSCQLFAKAYGQETWRLAFSPT